MVRSSAPAGVGAHLRRQGGLGNALWECNLSQFQPKKMMFVFFLIWKKWISLQRYSVFQFFQTTEITKNHLNFPKSKKKLARVPPYFFFFQGIKNQEFWRLCAATTFEIEILWQHKNLICKVVATQKKLFVNNFFCGNTKIQFQFLCCHKIANLKFVLPQNCKFDFFGLCINLITANDWPMFIFNMFLDVISGCAR